MQSKKLTAEELTQLLTKLQSVDLEPLLAGVGGVESVSWVQKEQQSARYCLHQECIDLLAALPNPTLSVTSTPIVLNHPNMEANYHLGKIRIELGVHVSHMSISTECLKVYRTSLLSKSYADSAPPPGSSSLIHPHMSHGYSVCFGHYQDLVASALFESRIQDLLLLLGTFFHTYNPGYLAMLERCYNAKKEYIK